MTSSSFKISLIPVLTLLPPLSRKRYLLSDPLLAVGLSLLDAVGDSV
jgi:hypothetical protein